MFRALFIICILMSTISSISAQDSTAESITLTIINHSDETICGLLVATAQLQTTDITWGEDLLQGRNVIAPGEEYELSLMKNLYHINLYDCRRTLLTEVYELAIYETLSIAYPDDFEMYEYAAYRMKLAYEASVVYLHEDNLNHSTGAEQIYDRLGNRAMQTRVLRNTGLVYMELSLDDDALSALEEALNLAITLDYQLQRSWILTDIGLLHHKNGDTDSALNYFEDALAIVESLDNGLPTKIILLGNIGWIYLEDDDPEVETALDTFETAIWIANDNEEISVDARIFNGAGYAHYILSNFEQTLQYYQQALTAARLVDDRWYEANISGNIGLLHHTLEEYDQALLFYESALETYREFEDHLNIGIMLSNLALVNNSLGENQIALDYVEEALVLVERTEDYHTEAGLIHTLGNIYHAMEDYDVAVEHYQNAISLATDIEATELISLARINIAMINQQDKNFQPFQPSSGALQN